MTKQLNYYLKSISYFKVIKIPKHGKKYIDKNDRFCNTRLPFIDGLCRLFLPPLLEISLFPSRSPYLRAGTRDSVILRE